MKIIPFIAICIFSCFSITINAQTGTISGKVSADGKPAELATVKLYNSSIGAVTDSTGSFSIKNVLKGKHTITISRVGYNAQTRQVIVNENQTANVLVDLIPTSDNLGEVVVTGTLKEVKRIESPVPVEVYTPAFFRKNPTPNIFDALQNHVIGFDDYNEMVEKILNLLSNQEEVFSKRVKTYEFARSNLLWENYENNIFEAYKEA